MAGSAGSRTSLVPPYGEPTQWKRQFAVWMHEANKGHIPITGRVTLTPNENATTVIDSRAGPTSFVDFMPLTANAAREKGILAITFQTGESFKIEHTNNSLTDRSYIYCIIG